MSTKILDCQLGWPNGGVSNIHQVVFQTTVAVDISCAAPSPVAQLIPAPGPPLSTSGGDSDIRQATSAWLDIVEINGSCQLIVFLNGFISIVNIPQLDAPPG